MGNFRPGRSGIPERERDVFRKLHGRLVFAYARRSKLIVAAVRKPYVSNRRKARFGRRAKRWLGLSEYRPLIFLDASFINMTSEGGYTWAPSGLPGGGVVAEKNAGGTGGRWAILHVLADWRDEEGSIEGDTPGLDIDREGTRAVARRIRPAVWIHEKGRARPVAGGRYRHKSR